MISKWITAIIMVLGVSLVRYLYGSLNAIEFIIVAVVFAGLGGAIGAIFEILFGKHEYKVIDFVDNILWFAGYSFVGLLLAGVVLELIEEYLAIVPFRNFNLSIITFSFATYFTLRKIKKKSRIKESKLEI